MSNYQIKTAQNVSLQLNFASLGDRIAAYIIDNIIIAGIGLFVGLILYYTGVERMGVIVILFLPLMFYSLLFEIFNNGQSPGKKKMDIQVQSIESGEVTVGSYLLRWLVRIVDFSLFSGLIALVCVAATDKKQRVGDLAAGTTVVSLKKKTTHSKAILGQIKADYKPIYGMAGNLTANNIEIIKKLINSTPSPGRTSAIEKLVPKIEAIIGEKHASNTSIRFLTDVLKDYNYFESGMDLIDDTV